MRTRRDQVQAYRFVTRRIVSAMLSGQPEAVERPMRRLGYAVFASAMVAALLIAAVGIWGLVTGQGRDLSDHDRILVINSETFARYVYIEGILYPVENLASARLILETDQPEVRNESPATLDRVPRGPRLGIPGAPDALPRAEALLSPPWRLCSVPPGPDEMDPLTTIVIGEDVPGGQRPGEDGLYLAGPDGAYLLVDDRLLRLTHQVAPVALGISAVTPTPIGPPLRNALMVGPDLDVVLPEGLDEPTGLDIGGEAAPAGAVYATGGQHYVATHDGLRPIGELTVALRTSIGDTQVRDITGGEVSRHLHDSTPLEPEGYPLRVPLMHPAVGQPLTVCARYDGPVEDGPAVTAEVFTTAPPAVAPERSVVLRQADADAVAAADRMRLRTGAGALVRAASATGTAAEQATVFLITDEGVKYPLGAGDAQAALGYGEVEPYPVPADLLELVPTGPALDVASAQQTERPH